MATIEVKSLDSPDETRPFADKGQAEVISIGGGTVLRGTFEPGWRWSEHVSRLPEQRAASLLTSCTPCRVGWP